MFVHLRGRSTYSMLEGIWSITEIFQKAKNFWQQAIAITDIYGLYGMVDFYIKSKSFEIKPIIWVEIPYTPHIASFQMAKWITRFPTLTILVKDAEWYHNLLRLVSEWYRHTQWDDIPMIDSMMLQSYHTWLIVLVGGLESYAYQSLTMYNDEQRCKEHIEQLISIMWSEDTIIDITAQPYTAYPYLSLSNEYLLKSAQMYGLSAITTSGYFYPDASQKTTYETALAIKDGKRIYDMDARKIVGDHHILSEQEVYEILKNNNFSDTMITTLIDTTNSIADRCNVKITLWQALFPQYDTPDDIKNLYEQHRDQLIID